MVKRCSAKNCYNSQLTHKIAYFGYPKNETISRQWAQLAGREDLAEKRLENLTKYYLCSDHFTTDCFLNPEVDDKSFLRLNRTLAIPLPSIFEDNLMKNVKLVTENPEKFVNYTKHSNEAADNRRSHELASPTKKNEKQCKMIDVKPEPETYVEYLDEELEISRTDQTTESIGMFDVFCRLCARTAEELIPIFDEDGDLHEETECLKLMPSGLIGRDDGLPQYTCAECLEKLQSCVNIIDGFVFNQSLFVSE